MFLRKGSKLKNLLFRPSKGSYPTKSFLLAKSKSLMKFYVNYYSSITFQGYLCLPLKDDPP